MGWGKGKGWQNNNKNNGNQAPYGGGQGRRWLNNSGNSGIGGSGGHSSNGPPGSLANGIQPNTIATPSTMQATQDPYDCEVTLLDPTTRDPQSEGVSEKDIQEIEDELKEVEKEYRENAHSVFWKYEQDKKDIEAIAQELEQLEIPPASIYQSPSGSAKEGRVTHKKSP